MIAKRIVLTPGEPAGIGPELTVRLAQAIPAGIELVAVCDPSLLQDAAQRLKLPLVLRESDELRRIEPGSALAIWPVPLAEPAEPGMLNPRNAPATLSALRRATEACLAERAAALVTGPMHKGIINDGMPGAVFSGHTEYLAGLSGIRTPVMLLVADSLRVALATTHLPLAAVPAAITAETLKRTLRVLHAGLKRDFGLAYPRILVTGLNPHAGEGGHLGREEIDVIVPTLEALRAEGLMLEGPLPADTLFTPRVLERGDAVLAMYHDQGLPVLKHLGFGHAVNVTLGLPFIRTSVDHGVALDLAGKGTADASSLRAALACALDLIERRAA